MARSAGSGVTTGKTSVSKLSQLNGPRLVVNSPYEHGADSRGCTQRARTAPGISINKYERQGNRVKTTLPDRRHGSMMPNVMGAVMPAKMNIGICQSAQKNPRIKLALSAPYRRANRSPRRWERQAWRRCGGCSRTLHDKI